MIGTTLKQRFLIERELGRGGMGAVYRAIDQVLQRPVAIKVLRDLAGESVGRKLRLEAQILARLMHENIVRLYDFDEFDGTFYFIMEEVDGPSYFHRWKHLPMPGRLAVLEHVALALDYAHHQGVIHRDVKPGNILLTSAAMPKLSDFGLSLMADATQEIGVARGTPMYMSPEQARGHRLDHRSDLYALGVLLYEGATGTPPFQGNSMAIMSQHVNAEAPAPRSKNPQISADFDLLIRDLMSKDPAARPPSGKAVAETLRSLIQGDRWASGHTETAAMPAAQVAGPQPPSSASGGPGTGSGSGSGSTRRSHFDVSARLSGNLAVDAGTRPGPMARAMVEFVASEPIELNPDERYLAGHYLAYLLGGSRRRGFLLRRPLDPLNADRARLLLAMTWLSLTDGDDATVRAAARLLDERPDVRPLLSPVVVIKYLRGRSTPARRKKFRLLRQRLQAASSYGSKHMVDQRGLLNPGLMPQTLDDLRKVAPERFEVDDELVGRWNRLTEVWLARPEFRQAVLAYATTRAAGDPASVDLWPEVVYPLIERARWQRRFRGKYEAFWDHLSAPLAPAPGVRMDRVLSRAVPLQVVAELDDELAAFADAPEGLDPFDDAPAPEAEGPTLRLKVTAAQLKELASEQESAKELVPLTDINPLRFNLGELRELWKEALENLKQGAKGGHRQVPVGPYRLAVIASIRGRKAGTIAIQGMANKQIEMLTPSMAGGSASRPILAAWPYANRSLVLTHLDSQSTQKYILWDAPTAQQTNFDDPADLNHALFLRSMEVPDQLDKVLTTRFRPLNAG